MFYPADPAELRMQIEEFLAAVPSVDGPAPKAIIVPHAGFMYSGPVAASVYARIRPAGVRRVVLVGPSHNILFRGAVAEESAVWRTPLGAVPIEAPPGIPASAAAHRPEHSLEVQVPFLQTVLDEFVLIPLIVGNATVGEIADVLRALWGGPETLVVISSDLSHYEKYETAQAMDRAAAKAILDLNPLGLGAENACGRIPVSGLLQLAKEKELRVEQVDLRNSGDTAGSSDQVVGYGAFAFYE